MKTTIRTLALALPAVALAACPEPSPVETGPDEEVIDGVDATPQTLKSNFGLCNTETFIFPIPGEEGDSAAVRLTPLEQPFDFVLEEVRYSLAWAAERVSPHGPLSCNPSLAHSVRIWSNPGSAPADQPATAADNDFWVELEVAAITPAEEARDSVLDLRGRDLIVPAGHHIYVAVQLTGSWGDAGGDVTCIATCQETSAIPLGTNLWGSRDGDGFEWSLLGDYPGLGGHWYTIEAAGHAVDE